MIREAVPRHIPIIGNGDVKCFEDFQRFKDISGADSVMSGYGALLDPTVFQPEPVLLEDVLRDYLSIARRHNNGLVDVQRHIQWMIKRRTNGATAIKAQLFQTRNLPEIQDVLSRLSPPLKFTIPALETGEVEKIVYPKTVEQMTPKELKLHNARQKKNETKLAKKLKRQEAHDPDTLHVLDESALAATSAPASS